MSVVEPGPQASNLVQRVKDILLQPTKTWEVIDGEPATVGDLYKGYVIPLALIPAVCGLIGAVAFGFGGMFGITFRPAIQWVVASQVTSFLATLAGVYVIALIIDALAPNFGGTKNQIQAFKVAAYSGTAAWVAGVFQLIPNLSFLGILGLYSLYLFYKGLPKLMKAPDDKALSYTVVVVIVAIVVNIIIAAIVAPIMSIGRHSYGMGQMGRMDSGEVTMPGGGKVDLGKLEEATRQMERAAAGGAVKAADASDLKTYLPPAVAGFTRSEVTTSSGGVGDLTGSSAVGVYAKGESRITLSVTDMGAAGALTAMASAFNIESSTERDGHYEKVGRVDGRMTMEEYDETAKSGEFGVLVADRFMVQAEGDGVSMDQLKAAVRAVGLERLEKAAKTE